MTASRTTPASVRDHLRAERVYQQQLVRFIENHDETRAALDLRGRRERARRRS